MAFLSFGWVVAVVVTAYLRRGIFYHVTKQTLNIVFMHGANGEAYKLHITLHPLKIAINIRQ